MCFNKLDLLYVVPLTMAVAMSLKGALLLQRLCVLIRPTRVSDNRGYRHLFQWNRRSKAKFRGEQGNKDNIMEHGTYFLFLENKPIYFRATRECVTPCEGLINIPPINFSYCAV